MAEHTQDSISLQVDLVGVDSYIISWGNTEGEVAEAQQAYAGLLLQVDETLTLQARRPELPESSTDDMFERLETEMSNDKIWESASMAFSMQDTVAVRALKEIFADGSSTVDAEELVDMARWFNRRMHVFYSLADAAQDEESKHLLESLRAICMQWSCDLLESAV